MVSKPGGEYRKWPIEAESPWAPESRSEDGPQWRPEWQPAPGEGSLRVMDRTMDFVTSPTVMTTSSTADPPVPPTKTGLIGRVDQIEHRCSKTRVARASSTGARLKSVGYHLRRLLRNSCRASQKVIPANIPPITMGARSTWATQINPRVISQKRMPR